MAAVIPGLPDDMAIKCLSKVPRKYYPTLVEVCREWKKLILDPNSYLYKERASNNLTESSVFFLPCPSVFAIIYYAEIYMDTGERRGGTYILHENTAEICRNSKWVACGHFVMALGGNNPSFNMWDTIRRIWVRAPNMHVRPRANFAYGVIDNVVYVAGGTVHRKMTRSTECYNLATNRWTALSPLPSEITVINSFVIHKKLYVLGKSSHDQKPYVCFYYAPGLDTWREDEWMHTALSEKDQWMYRMAAPFHGAMLYTMDCAANSGTLVTRHDKDTRSSEVVRERGCRTHCGLLGCKNGAIVLWKTSKSRNHLDFCKSSSEVMDIFVDNLGDWKVVAMCY